MQVVAKERGFYGRIREPGEEPFEIKSKEELGSWMECVGVLSVKHHGAGKYIVVNASGDRVGDFSGTKEEAEAEAYRLAAS